MTKKTIISLIVIFLNGFGLIQTPSLFAEEKPISIHIDKRSVILGDHCLFTVKAKTKKIPPPQISGTEDFDVEYLGTEQGSHASFHLVINGKQIRSEASGGEVKYRYKIIPKNIGRLTFPSLDIGVAPGKVMRTVPFEIDVVALEDTSQNIFLIIEADKNDIYLGEKITLNFKWYFNKDIQGYEWNIPWLSSLKNFVVREPEMDPNKSYQRIILNGNEEILADKTAEDFKGEQFAVISFRKVLIPLAAGEFQLPGATLRCEVVKGYEQGRRRASFFNDFFGSDFDTFFGLGRRAVTESFVTKSPMVHLIVREVPGEDRPESYQNALGEFQFDVQISPQKVKMGGLITVKMEISGEGGNVEQIKMPALPELSSFRGYEPESSTETFQKDGKTLTRKKFEKVLVPTAEGTFDIPKIDFTYFSTVSRQFQTLSQGPFSIEVERGEEEEEKVRYISIEKDEGEDVNEIKIIKQDIQFIKTSLGKLYKKKGPIYKNLFVLSIFFLFPVLLSFSLYFYAKKHNRLATDASYRKEQKAYQVALGGLKRTHLSIDQPDKDFYFEVSKVLSTYLSSKFYLPTGEITSDVAEELLKKKGIEEKLITEVKEIYDATDRIKYTSFEGILQDKKDKKMLFEKVQENIKQLEKAF